MSDTGNPFYDAALEVGQEIAWADRESRKAKAVPFGMEKVGAEQLRRRLFPENREEGKALRRQILARPGGRDAILKLFQKKGEKP